MKLGIFDSGLGGLLIARSIRQALPDIDIIYFGDTLHLPYGNRSHDAIYEYSKRAIQFLFEQDCNLIVTACNTVSASALRKLQQDYLPNSPYKDRRILGVVVPTLEHAIDHGYKRLGLIATNYTIASNIYEEELQKLDPDIRIFQKDTPLLVPLIENNGIEWVDSVLEHYLKPLLQENIECLILGCTHYPFLKEKIKKICGAKVSLITQDEIIPHKLNNYLSRHPEILDVITHSANIEFLVSDLTDGYLQAAREIYADNINIEVIKFSLETNSYTRKPSNNVR
ncbi:MAG: glutamate racemase [Alphaproteobacteria bacterium]